MSLSPSENPPDLRAIGNELADSLIERGLTLFQIERLAGLMVHAARLGGAAPGPMPASER